MSETSPTPTRAEFEALVEDLYGAAFESEDTHPTWAAEQKMYAARAALLSAYEALARERDRDLADMRSFQAKFIASDHRASAASSALETERQCRLLNEQELHRADAEIGTLRSALETMRARVGALATEWERYATDVWDEQPHTAGDYEEHAKALRAALGSPSTPAVACICNTPSSAPCPVHGCAAPDATPEDAPLSLSTEAARLGIRSLLTASPAPRQPACDNCGKPSSIEADPASGIILCAECILRNAGMDPAAAYERLRAHMKATHGVDLAPAPRQPSDTATTKEK